ncbi:MAG: ferritin family protein [Dehalococcoidia bacterium]
MKSKLGDIIGKAIQNEEDARLFYTDLAKKVKDKEAKEALTFMAGEEKKHKDFLVSYRDGKNKSALKMEDTVDYKVAEYNEKPDIKGDLKSKDVYLIAAHRELNSHNFYNALAEAQPKGEVKDMLLTMAQEELKHKEKVEYLYSNTAFTEAW